MNYPSIINNYTTYCNLVALATLYNLDIIIYKCPLCPSAAPAASALSAHYSHRSVVIMGGLMCSFGVMVGAFARNLTELYLTVGFLNGTCLKQNKHI